MIMRTRSLTALVVATVAPLMVGCQNANQLYREQLMQAHTAMRIGQPGRASRALASADRIAAEHKLTRSVAQDLLAAEVRLQRGDVYQALETCQGVAGKSKPDSLDRARAEEITGKGALRQAEYVAATEHFRAADSLYERSADHRRMADLINLTNGLSAYAEGRLGEARATWEQISDSKIRDSINRAMDDMRSADSTALAR